MHGVDVDVAEMLKPSSVPVSCSRSVVPVTFVGRVNDSAFPFLSDLLPLPLDAVGVPGRLLHVLRRQIVRWHEILRKLGVDAVMSIVISVQDPGSLLPGCFAFSVKYSHHRKINKLNGGVSTAGTGLRPVPTFLVDLTN
jgi:hypothetical protein